MEKKQQKRTSKFLSLVLRHQPETIGIELDDSGWVAVEELLAALAKNKRPLSREELETVVRENDKQRFAFSDDGTLIRANQGHSVEVKLELLPTEPPEFLWHGTTERFVDAIRNEGLKKMQRHHVHLHPDVEVATTVGSRRGKPVLLKVYSGRMHQEGFEFFVSDNGVWLVDHVPPTFIE